MNYLKSITTSVLQSTGVTFPFSIGERIPGLDSHSSIWDIREASKKDDGTPLTLFIYDSTAAHSRGKDRRVLIQLAKNALKKLRTIRHPGVIKYIDSIETETHIYIATERVRPLESVMTDWDIGGSLAGKDRGKTKEEWIGWGVKSTSAALAFLNSPPLSLHHSYLLPSTIFITPALEWRLSGFELLTSKDDDAGILWSLGGAVPGDIGERCPPEVQKSGWATLRNSDPAQHDTYLLALLLFTLYNPRLPLPSLTSQPSPASSGALPKALFPLWRKMLNPNSRTRLSTVSFVNEAESSGLWAANTLVRVVEGLDNFELQSEGDKLNLLKTIKDSTSSGLLPLSFSTYKVLPSLLHSLSLPTAPSSSMLPLILELGKNVPEKEYGKIVSEPVVKLWASPDRGTRMALLEGLEEYIDKLDSRTVSDKIWPHLITGFSDTVPVIREATVKAIHPLSSKLSDRILNNDLLRILAKTQTDSEPSIRTNTCILLGRLAPILSTQTKKKVLVPAFARSLKDGFIHARIAGLMALMASVESFDREDLAGRVMPAMSFTLVDKEMMVREQAFKAMNMFMSRLTDMVKDMPETSDLNALGPTTTSQAPTSSKPLVNTATGAAGVLAGWAMSSLSKQLAASEAQSTMETNSTSDGLSVSKPSFGGSSRTSPNLSASATPSFTSPIVSPTPSEINSRFSLKTTSKLNGISSQSSQTGGLKLNNARKPKQSLADQLAAEVAAEEVNDWDSGNAWGNDDLMDVNADDDDWSTFESAPVPGIHVLPPQSYYVTPAQSKPKPKSASTNTALVVPAATESTSAPTVQSPKPIKPPTISTPLAPASVSPSSFIKSPLSSRHGSETTPPLPTVTTPQPSLAGLSKEEKDKEMARRREERKAKIAAMKKGKA
ncbi:hypothetical protein L204_100054 [Cryptococcus depauperatus]